MRAITPGVKVVGGLLGIRVCFLLIFVFVCAIDRSSTIVATTRSTTGAVSPRHPRTLTDEQRRSVVTIEFNFNGIDRKNRTAVAIAYRELRKKILEGLNRRKSTTASTYSTTAASKITTVAATVAPSTHDPTTTATSTTPSTTTATTTITTTPTSTAGVTTITTSTTTSTPAITPTTTVTNIPTTSRMTTAAPTTTPTTTEATTTPTTTVTNAPTTSPTTTAAPTTTPTTTKAPQVPESKKRRKRSSEGNSDTLTEEDLFIDNDHEVDESGNLIISLFIDKEGFVDLDLGELLLEAANASYISGKIEASPRMRVNIYKGLPKELSPVETSQLGFNLWLPVLLASSALLLIFSFIFVRYWSSSRNKKTGGALDREKFIPVLMG